MKNILRNKTLWLTIAIMLVVAGGIAAVSIFGASNTATTPTNTQTISENTVTTVPEPPTEPVTEPATLTEPETTTAPEQPPVVQPPNISELLRDVALSAELDTGYGIATESSFVLTGLEELEELVLAFQAGCGGIGELAAARELCLVGTVVEVATRGAEGVHLVVAEFGQVGHLVALCLKGPDARHVAHARRCAPCSSSSPCAREEAEHQTEK